MTPQESNLLLLLAKRSRKKLYLSTNIKRWYNKNYRNKILYPGRVYYKCYICEEKFDKKIIVDCLRLLLAHAKKHLQEFNLHIFA